MRTKKLTELSVSNRTLRDRVRPVSDFVSIRLTGEIQEGTGGRGRDRKCHKLSQNVVTFYDEFYDDL